MFKRLRLKKGLEKSSNKFSDNLKAIFTYKKIDDEMLEELQDSLIMSDVGTAVSAKLIKKLADTKINKDCSEEDIKGFLIDEIEKILSPVAKDLEIDDSKKPFVILMVGVNGSGKTTSIGKIASSLKKEGKKVMLVAGDTFRAAAVEQLQVWGDRAGFPVMKKDLGSDAASLAYEAYEKALKEDIDVLIIDTAGRLHNNSNLMQELEKINRVLKKHDEELPHKTLLSLDATTGQNAITQVEQFGSCVDVNGLILTKLDGTAKGGIILAIANSYPNLPINYIGIGEKEEDLQSFNARDFAEDLLG